MKLTPLLLFLLILVVLVIAVTTLKNPIRTSVEKEGFVQFKANVVPQTETVVPLYSSRPIVKLYDNLFVDRKNINIVEVDSLSGNIVGNVVANVDSTGVSIKGINMQTRSGDVTSYYVTSATTTTRESDESKISSITSSYKSDISYNSICSTTSKYQLFYIPWNTNTYIHGIEKGTSTTNKGRHLFTYIIPSDEYNYMNAILYTNTGITINSDTNNSTDNPNSLNKMVVEASYRDESVYQLNTNVKFDTSNGNIITKDSTNNITVYDRSGQTKTTDYDSNIMPHSNFNPWIKKISDTIELLYVQSGRNTLVILFKRDDAYGLKILNMGRFTKNGIDTGTPSTNNSTSDYVPSVPSIPSDLSATSDYYRWWYFNSVGPETNGRYSNNYLLKTQIVPPVCPACPSATCASTAGSTGSSSKKDKDGNIITDTVDTAGNVVNKTVDTAGNVVNKTVDTAGNIVNKTVDTTANLLTSGGTGATSLLKSGASGTSDLLKSGTSGTVDLLKSGASGTSDLLKSGASGTVDLLKDAGSGVLNIAGKTLDTTGNIVGRLASENNHNAVGGAGQYYGGLNTPNGYGYSAPGFSRGAPPTDNYSYYGALPNKGSNYIPITADFSAFKK